MQVLASEPSGSPKVETLTEYEVRITLTKDDKAVAFQLAGNYNKYFKVKEYLWSYEIASDSNYHIHGMVTYINNKEPPSSTRSEWMAKQVAKKQGKSTSHHTEVDDVLKYGAYILKDGEFITNMDKKKIDDFLLRVAQVKEDKKKSAVQKLLDKIRPALDAIDAYNATIPEDDFLPDEQLKKSDTRSGKIDKNPISKKKKIPITLDGIAKMILKIYHDEWNKDMQWSKLKQYTIYIADKCGHCGDEINNNIEKLF